MHISSITTYEYVSLIGHYHSFRQKEKLDPRLLEKGYTEDQLKEMYKRLDLNFDSIYSLNLRIDGDLKRFHDPMFNYYLSLFDKYDRHGLLPFTGPITRQPAKVMEMFQVFEQLKYEMEKREYDKQAKKLKEKQKHGRR